jgi:hypothetical protein
MVHQQSCLSWHTYAAGACDRTHTLVACDAVDTGRVPHHRRRRLRGHPPSSRRQPEHRSWRTTRRRRRSRRRRRGGSDITPTPNLTQMRASLRTASSPPPPPLALARQPPRHRHHLRSFRAMRTGWTPSTKLGLPRTRRELLLLLLLLLLLRSVAQPEPTLGGRLPPLEPRTLPEGCACCRGVTAMGAQPGPRQHSGCPPSRHDRRRRRRRRQRRRHRLRTTPRTTGCQRSAAVQPRCVLAPRGSFCAKRGTCPPM